MKATIKQVVAMLSGLESNLPQDELNNLEFQEVQAINDNLREAGIEFMKFIRNRARVIVVMSQWKVWKTCVVGGRTKDQLIADIEQSGGKISEWARDMMNQKKFKVSRNAKSVDFVKLQVSELGFTEMPTTDELVVRADSMGLDLCLPDDAPAVRARYKDQPPGDVIWIAMKQITDSDGLPRVFRLDCDSSARWLRGGVARLGGRWRLGHVIVFRLRKPSSNPPKAD